ncbi:hypothetical protein [Pseudonocardia pini]|uniref:hypothetical protein n=1 Tax=Pseudonocardia pini TaxID=2758030 RepID=UPI0015F08055|nr:hypothetical protein [Pseudonocardia pini]
MRAPKSVEVGLDLKLFKVSGRWEPTDEERNAAWELYVELITRVGVVPLRDGVLRESLHSLYTIFESSRQILRKYGPAVAEPKPSGEFNFGYLCVAMLNYTLRPLLSYWHPELQSWESCRDSERSIREHEASWTREQDLRNALHQTGDELRSFSRILANACGVPDLSTAVPSRT